MVNVEHVAPEEAVVGSSVAEAPRHVNPTTPFAPEGPSLVATQTMPFVDFSGRPQRFIDLMLAVGASLGSFGKSVLVLGNRGWRQRLTLASVFQDKRQPFNGY